MADNHNDDGIAVLIGLGFLAVVGIGVLRVLKAIAEYEPNQVISNGQAAKLAASYTPSFASKYERTPNCEIHGIDADLCDNCGDCMECVGRDDDQFCVKCYYD